MKNLQITLFLLASLVLLTQTVRHVHLYFFELSSHSSAIDPFESDYQIKKKVTEERSTKTLVEEYRITQSQIKELEAGKTKDEIETLKKQEKDLYDRNYNLRSEITTREDRLREIRDLWIFCCAGLGFVAVGSICYLKQARWTGMAFLIAGFAELIWWSSPSFFMGGAHSEYELLLINKITISLIGLGLLHVAWRFRTRWQPKTT